MNTFLTTGKKEKKHCIRLFHLRKKNLIFLGKNEIKKRKVIHSIIQTFLEKKKKSIRKKDQPFYSDGNKNKKKVSFHSYFYLEIDFRIDTQTKTDVLFHLANYMNPKKCAKFSKKVSLIVLHGLDCLTSGDQLRLFFLINAANKEFFFLVTAGQLEKLRKEWKTIFFFFFISDVKKFRKKNREIKYMLPKKWHFLKNQCLKNKISTPIFRNVHGFKKATILVFLWFFESRIHQKKNILYTIANYFFPFSVLKKALYHFLSNFSMAQSLANFVFLNRNNLFMLFEIYFCLDKIFFGRQLG
jgi:hypothetical protein